MEMGHVNILTLKKGLRGCKDYGIQLLSQGARKIISQEHADSYFKPKAKEHQKNFIKLMY